MKTRPRNARPKRTSDHGEFSGDPETLWLTQDEPDRRMRILKEFSFRDPKGKEWVAPASYIVDGASIPRPLWSLIGSPYTGDYRRASVVHDKACDDADGDRRARRAADRMFYHACRAGYCTIVEATLLYIGVRIGAWMSYVPAWNSAAPLERVGPRVARSPAEDRLEADYRLVADLVLQKEETDDPSVIERRTDKALSTISGVNLRTKRARR